MNTIELRNVGILGGSFRNFRGEARQFNNAGNRNCCITLPEDVATQLANEGWNIKTLLDKETGEVITHYTQVVINYNSRRPPIIRRCYSSSDYQDLDQDTIAQLDYDPIIYADVCLGANPTEHPDGSITYKGYVNAMNVYVQRLDPFAADLDMDNNVPFN